jgi:hypothetical protein
MDTDKFVTLFNDQIQELKTSKPMLARFGELLPANCKELGLPSSEIPKIISIFRLETKSVSSRATLVNICRQVLTDYLKSIQNRQKIDESYSDEEDFDEEVDMQSSINLLIEDRFTELQTLSIPARMQLEQLILEMVDRYRL